jgi:hypothetical protein
MIKINTKQSLNLLAVDKLEVVLLVPLLHLFDHGFSITK